MAPESDRLPKVDFSPLLALGPGRHWLTEACHCTGSLQGAWGCPDDVTLFSPAFPWKRLLPPAPHRTCIPCSCGPEGVPLASALRPCQSLHFISQAPSPSLLLFRAVQPCYLLIRPQWCRLLSAILAEGRLFNTSSIANHLCQTLAEPGGSVACVRCVCPTAPATQ